MNSGFFIYSFPDLFKNYRRFLSLIILCLFSSCGYKVNSVGSNLLPSTESVISGVISPLVGSIAEDKTQHSLLINNAYSAACADPVYAKLFRLESDGSVNDNSPLDSQLVSADAKYSFDLNALSVTSASQNIEYLVKVEGCNGDVYKRPVTAFDKDQNLDARTTVIAEVINSNTLLSTTLNQVDKKEIVNLIESVSGTTLSSALASLTNTGAASSQFRRLFGVNPSVILSAKPEVQLIFPTSIINELALSVFSVSTFHVDPNYSFAYSWKLDGVVKSTSSTWNYIPSANNSGDHQVDLYVGIDDGTGHIDTTKPYYTKNFSIHVNNNIVPVAPSITLNSSNPSPVNTNTVAIDINTGVALTHCANFSHMAFTDTPTQPGIMQFNIDCSTSGTQTENITFSTGDGSKTIYLWAMDNEGTISAAKTLSLVLDTLPPTASFSFSSSILKGGAIKSISFNALDSGSGLQSLDLYYSSNNGSSYSLLSQLGLTDSSYSWSVPASDIAQAKLKLIAVDLTGQSTTVYSNLFEIDSTAPTAPSISRSSAATTLSRTVAINITCSADYDKILFSETSTTPTITDAAWESCASMKNFTVTTGDALKTIYAFTKDVAGNISTSSNVTMTLDTTSPSAPVANLTSASLSSSTSLTFTIPDCTDRASVFVSESATTPLASDSDWQSCVTTASAINYTLIGPVSQGSHTLYVYAKDAVGNVSAATTASMVYDTTNPTLSLSTSLGLLYKGGDTVALSFSASDANNLSSFKIYYTTDGTTYSPVVTLATSATTYTWTVPASNTATAKLKLEAMDNATTANSSIVYSDAFTVDSTAPSAPSLTRTSNQFSNSTNITMTVGSCTDTAYILISETNSQPSAGDSNWQLCSTTASAFSKTVSGEGAHTIYAWAKDAAGNIASSANSISMTLDTTAPVIAVTTPSAMQGNVSTGAVTWTLTETNVAASTNFTVEVYNGSTWVSVGTKAATSGVNSNTAYTLSSFAVPNVDVATAKVRVTLADAAGNSTTSESGSFTIDSTAPTISNFQLANGASSASGNVVAINLTSTDPGAAATGISSYCFALNSSMTSETCFSSIPATYSLPFSTGTYTVYVDIIDAVGNTSSTASYTISLILGTPPTLTFVSPTVSDTMPSSSGSALTIEWKALQSSSATLTTLNIQYLISGQTVAVDWPAAGSYSAAQGLSPTVNGSCSLTGVATGCVIVGMPSVLVGQKFTIKLSLGDSAGNIAVTNSSTLNGPSGLTLIAGADSSALGGTALATALSGSIVGLAKDPTTLDVYLLRTNDILKITASTGIMTRFIGASTTDAPINLTFIAAAMNTGNIDTDDLGNLYWSTTAGTYKYTKSTSAISLLSGIPASAKLRIVNSQIYYATVSGYLCGTYCGFYGNSIFKYNTNGTSTQIAGQSYTAAVAAGTSYSSYLTAASESASPTSVAISGWTVVPLTSTTEKVYFLSNPELGYFARDLYSISSDGLSIHLEKSNVNNGYGPQLSKYLSSRNAFALMDTNSGSVGSTFKLLNLSDLSTTSLSQYNGSIFDIADLGNGSVITLNNLNQIISLFDSSNARSVYAGVAPDSGDGGQAQYAQLRGPTEVSVTSDGTVNIMDMNNKKIRTINGSGVISSTIWGTTIVSTAVNGGVNSMRLSSGNPSSLVLSFNFASYFVTNTVGSVGSMGNGVSSGMVDMAGSCLYFCKTSSYSDATFAPWISSHSSPKNLGGYSTGSTVKAVSNLTFDGTTKYVFMVEVNGVNQRSYIKQIDASDNMIDVAGSTSGTFGTNAPPTVTVGSTLLGNSAGNFGNGIRVVNNVIYGVTNGVVYSGVIGGSWIKQVVSAVSTYGSHSPGFVVDKRGSSDPTQGYIYFFRSGTARLYYKPYSSTTETTTASEVLVADFTGVLGAPVIGDIDPNNAHTFYIMDGNSVYKYENSSLP